MDDNEMEYSKRSVGRGVYHAKLTLLKVVGRGGGWAKQKKICGGEKNMDIGKNFL